MTTDTERVALLSSGLMAATPTRGLRGAAHANAKLTDADVIAMRKRRAAGESLAELARCYGISPKTVSNIVRRASWRHLP